MTVTAELRFRRTFQDVMDARGWNVPDILMEESQLVLYTQPWRGVFLPLVLRQ